MHKMKKILNKSLLCVCCKSNKSIYEDNEEEDGSAVFCAQCVVVIHKHKNNKLHSILSIENEKNSKVLDVFSVLDLFLLQINFFSTICLQYIYMYKNRIVKRNNRNEYVIVNEEKSIKINMDQVIVKDLCKMDGAHINGIKFR